MAKDYKEKRSSLGYTAPDPWSDVDGDEIELSYAAISDVTYLLEFDVIPRFGIYGPESGAPFLARMSATIVRRQ